MITKNIGEFLVSYGLITVDQLRDCQQHMVQDGVSLQTCLITKKMATAEAIARAYAAYASLDYVGIITDKMADLDMLAKVPLKFLRDNVVIPISIDGRLVILTADPMKFQPLDEVNLLLGGEARYAVSSAVIIMEAINRYYPIEGTKQMIEELEGQEQEAGVAFEEIEEKDILSMATEAPIIKLVNNILFKAAKRGASDIHIEPFEKEIRVRYRIDGIMYDVMTPPKRAQGALISRLKIMANLNIAEKRMPQDGRIQIKVADKTIDLRVSILPVSWGERVVMRLLDRTRSVAKIDQIGLSDRDYAVLIKNIERPNGIIYVTGPTGSGKTTTLYSVLVELNSPEVNIITVEDPIEYQVAGIGQVQVREKVGLTFAIALRSILRQDPDVVMIGETRDPETAQIAIQAALTGHLVLSTLHTNSAPAAITRLIDMSIEPFLIASSVVLVVAQRLVRKLCGDCKKSYSPPVDLFARLGLDAQKASDISFYKAGGCEKCLNTGYLGRLPIFELMEVTEGIVRLAMERADTARITRQAIADGMSPLIEDGVRKIRMGLTTIEEVLSVATIEHGMLEQD
ncbi:MAG: type II secretion system ATPase GspE [Candidatus Dependentiae bacterium]|nr:type II secretion system ATPase GspE [Candidatus Dependentiae bacterium]